MSPSATLVLALVFLLQFSLEEADMKLLVSLFTLEVAIVSGAFLTIILVLMLMLLL